VYYFGSTVSYFEMQKIILLNYILSCKAMLAQYMLLPCVCLSQVGSTPYNSLWKVVYWC